MLLIALTVPCTQGSTSRCRWFVQIPFCFSDLLLLSCNFL